MNVQIQFPELHYRTDLILMSSLIANDNKSWIRLIEKLMEWKTTIITHKYIYTLFISQHSMPSTKTENQLHKQR